MVNQEVDILADDACYDAIFHGSVHQMHLHHSRFFLIGYLLQCVCSSLKGVVVSHVECTGYFDLEIDRESCGFGDACWCLCH